MSIETDLGHERIDELVDLVLEDILVGLYNVNDEEIFDSALKVVSLNHKPDDHPQGWTTEEVAHYIYTQTVRLRENLSAI